jgi:2,3-bisphosphoglycerate-independent phosphoglycerate mutase
VREAAPVVWVFVDGLGLRPARTPSVVAMPALDRALGAPALVDADRPLAPGPGRRRWSLDATLGVDGLPGTATGQATLVTGRNAARAFGRHVHAFPGPRLKAFMDEAGTVFDRLAAAGARLGLITAYPSETRETALRYALRRAGADLAPSAGQTPLWPGLGLGPDALVGTPEAAALDASAFHAAALAARRASPYDLAVVETDICDRAGHLREGRAEAQARALGYVDRFVDALWRALAPDGVVVVASDHGSVEEPARRGHTRNRVPLVALGAADVAGAPPGEDLTAFAPWLHALVDATRRRR